MNRLVITDSTLCISCHAHEAACSKTYHQHDLQSMPRLKVILNEKESISQLCHQCEDASRAIVCPINAINRVDDAVQLNKSLCVSYKLCGIACPSGAIEFSGSRPLHIPVNVNTLKAPPAPPAPTRVSSLLDQVPGVRTIAVRCDLYNFDEQGPTCMRMCPTKAPRLVSNMDITRISKRKRKLTLNTDFGDLTLLQQIQSGDAK